MCVSRKCKSFRSALVVGCGTLSQISNKTTGDYTHLHPNGRGFCAQGKTCKSHLKAALCFFFVLVTG